MFTTLKALKWTYDLGIKQERVRIAALLQTRAQDTRVSAEIFSNMLREEVAKPKSQQSRIDQIERAKAVNDRVAEIIDEIFRPNGEWTPPASYLFPDDKHSKRTKEAK